MSTPFPCWSTRYGREVPSRPARDHREGRVERGRVRRRYDAAHRRAVDRHAEDARDAFAVRLNRRVVRGRGFCGRIPARGVRCIGGLLRLFAGCCVRVFGGLLRLIFTGIFAVRVFGGLLRLIFTGIFAVRVFGGLLDRLLHRRFCVRSRRLRRQRAAWSGIRDLLQRLADGIDEPRRVGIGRHGKRRVALP